MGESEGKHACFIYDTGNDNHSHDSVWIVGYRIIKITQFSTKPRSIGHGSMIVYHVYRSYVHRMEAYTSQSNHWMCVQLTLTGAMYYAGRINPFGAHFIFPKFYFLGYDVPYLRST